MIRYDRDVRTLALGYAALAGWIDAVGFLKSGGLFVAFMTGNSTRLAVGVAELGAVAPVAAALIGLFVLGVFLNVLISESVGVLHRKVAASLGVTVLLLAAAGADFGGQATAAIALLCLAMGAANAIFRREGEVSIGVTYMTGTLVKLGHRLADSVRGVGDGGWTAYLWLWLSMVVGGAAGAWCQLRVPGASLWVGAAAALGLTGATWRVVRARPAGA